MAVQTFKCPKCGEEVVYEPQTIPSLRGKRPAKPATTTKVVYLTCVNDHTRPYTVHV